MLHCTFSSSAWPSVDTYAQQAHTRFQKKYKGAPIENYMKNIILLHDAFTNPTEYWYPYIQSMTPDGYTVISPELPVGAEQGFSSWIKFLDQYKEQIGKETIIISHGISSLLVLRLLETLSVPIRMYISIAGTAETPAHKALAPIAETFLQTSFNWQKIKSNIPSVVHIWNTKDPFVNPQLSQQFAELLPGKNKALSGTGHFTDVTENDLLSLLQNMFQEIQAVDATDDFTHQQQMDQQRKEDLAKSSIPSLVTYDTDVAQSIAGYQGTVISELLSEAREREKQEKVASPTNPKNVFYIIASIVLVLGGIAAVSYGFIPQIPQLSKIIQSPTKQYETTMLRVEHIEPFELVGPQNFQLNQELRALQTKDVPEKTFWTITPLSNGKRATLQQFADVFSLKFPVGFASKADDFIYGYYRTEGGVKTPFLLIHFQGYDIMYQLMRKWEDTIFNGTLVLFYPDQAISRLLKLETPSFKDSIVNNIPIRTATLSSGSSISYGFLTEQTLIISTSSDLAEPVLRRMIGR